MGDFKKEKRICHCGESVFFCKSQTVSTAKQI